MLKKIAGVIALTLIFGCAPSARTKPSNEIAQQVTVTDSKFDKSRFYTAPVITGGETFGVNYTAHLVAVQNKASNEVLHALSVNFMYVSNGWVFFDSASLPGGVSPVTRVVDRRVDSCTGRSCSYQETMSVAIPLEMLTKANGSLEIRFNSKRGYEIVDLPENYIAGYLAGVKNKIR